MTTFEVSLRAALEADPPQRRKAKRMQRILDAGPSRRRARQLQAWEDHVRVHLAAGHATRVRALGDKFDWSSIDWKKWLGLAIKIGLALLPLLLMFI